MSSVKTQSSKHEPQLERRVFERVSSAMFELSKALEDCTTQEVEAFFEHSRYIEGGISHVVTIYVMPEYMRLKR